METEIELRIQKTIAGHNARNASLKQLLIERNVDICSPRPIDFHFYVASQTDADRLVNALRLRGLTILVNRRAARPNPDLPWNVEAQVAQSVELTIQPEFTEDLVRLAESYNGTYDGWGTLI